MGDPTHDARQGMRWLDEVDDAGDDRQNCDDHQHDGDDRLAGRPARRAHRTHVFLLDRCASLAPAAAAQARSSVMTAERYYGRGRYGVRSSMLPRQI